MLFRELKELSRCLDFEQALILRDLSKIKRFINIQLLKEFFYCSECSNNIGNLLGLKTL